MDGRHSYDYACEGIWLPCPIEASAVTMHEYGFPLHGGAEARHRPIAAAPADTEDQVQVQDEPEDVAAVGASYRAPGQIRGIRAVTCDSCYTLRERVNRPWKRGKTWPPPPIYVVGHLSLDARTARKRLVGPITRCRGRRCVLCDTPWANLLCRCVPITGIRYMAVAQSEPLCERR